MNELQAWRRVVGGGCLLNVILTGVLLILVVAASSFTIDRIVWPFLLGASISLGASIYLLRSNDDGLSPVRRVLLAAFGVLLGSVLTVLGIAGFLLIPGG